MKGGAFRCAALFVQASASELDNPGIMAQTPQAEI
jgi:hypothetical protein